jgi:D-alanyl-D-alanine carboxypeptidase
MAQSKRPKRATVGRDRGSAWTPLHALSVGAVVIGVIAVVGVLTAAMFGGNGSNGGVDVTTQDDSSGEMVTGGTATAEPSADANTPAPTQEPSEDQPALVACGDVLAPMDKTHALPADCEPGDLLQLSADMTHGGMQRLRAEAAGAFAELVQGARRDGHELVAVSAYRSYADQVAAYESNVQQFGKEYADRTSAKPGRSEHQLGTTVDVSSARAGYGLESIEGTPEATWIAENSWRSGFIVSYPEGKEDVTGYAYEPWHIRYVGKDLAAKVHQSGLTLHEYLLK